LQTKTDVYSFPKRCVLNHAADFRDLFQLGKKIKTPYFALLIKPTQHDYPRLGLVVAKKAIRRAVHRNQIKRIIRESFRHHQQILCGYDTLVMVYHSANTLSKQVLRETLDKQWKKLITL